MPVPISLLVDDSCPFIHVFRNHWEDVHRREPETAYGARLLDVIPDDFLGRFCEVVERWGMAGKFSVVPAPAGKGDIVQGIEGFPPEATRAWCEAVRSRLGGRFDFCPEGITHNLAVDLERGGYFPQGESEWSQTQTRETLTPYLTRELQYLKDAGFDATGVTSPWVFGIQVEEEYIAAVVAAQKAVFGRDFSWYFLHMLHEQHDRRPWIAWQQDGAMLISVPTTVRDVWWDTIDSPRTDRAFVESVADLAITADGKGGAVRRVLDAGGWPIFLSHWQSFFSNGLETGLRVLDEIGRRVHENLRGEVEWMTCMEMARRTVEGKDEGRRTKGER